FEDAQRLAGTLDLELFEVGQVEIALDELCGVLREIRLTGLGELLHALRQADRMTDRRVLHGEVFADRAHADLARLDSHSDIEAEAARAAQLSGIGGQRSLEMEDGVT